MTAKSKTVSTMSDWAKSAGLLIMILAGLSGCTSTAHVYVDETFPTVVAAPRDVNAAIVMTEEFRNYQAWPLANTDITFGTAQVDLWGKAFRGLFSQVEVVASRDQAGPETDLIVIPNVHEVQLSTPSQSYLNVYEVWIKYRLDIETTDGVPIDSWFLPAYGKTPNAALLSKTKAIEEATVVALRDAGAKLILDFYRIPAIHGWFEQRVAAADS